MYAWIENAGEKYSRAKIENSTVSKTVAELYYVRKIWLMSDEETKTRPMVLRSDPQLFNWSNGNGRGVHESRKRDDITKLRAWDKVV